MVRRYVDLAGACGMPNDDPVLGWVPGRGSGWRVGSRAWVRLAGGFPGVDAGSDSVRCYPDIP